jgi:hypothetical protein
MTSPSAPDPLLEFEAPGRRRRTILISTAAIGVVLAVVALVIAGWRVFGEHMVAAARLQGLNATIEWRWDPVSWRNGILTTANLGHGNRLITDAELTHLGKLHHVESLDLSGCWRVTDDGLAVLEDLPELTELHLCTQAPYGWNPTVGDRGLAHVARLTKLETLSLAGSAVTDEGLKSLKDLKNLKSLDLGKTAITDAGLRTLKGLTQLQSVNLCGTLVTKEGVEDLRKSLSGTAAVESDYSDGSTQPITDETLIDVPYP